MRFAASSVCLVAVVCLLIVANVVADEWREENADTYPEARRGHSVTMVPLAEGGQEIMMYGGVNESFMPLGDLHRLNRDEMQWDLVDVNSPIAPLPRGNHAAAGYDGKLIIAWGFGTGTMDDIWSFDVATGEWTELQQPDVRPDPQSWTQLGDLGGGRFFNVGGLDDTGHGQMDSWIVDFSEDNAVDFRRVLCFEYPVYGSVPLVIDGDPAIFGGYGPTGNSNRLHVLRRDDPGDPNDLGFWEPLDPNGAAPLDRTVPAFANLRIPDGGKAAGWGDMVFILGGESSDKARASDDVQIYNTLTNTWSHGASMPMALSDFGAAVLPAEGDTYEIITFGGVNSNNQVVPWTFIYTSDVAVAGCTPSGTNLCLNGSRFMVEVNWQDFQGNTGVGNAVGLTADTGYFWYFDQNNVEMVIKVLDARGINDFYWVFYGSLSNVQFELTVTDTETDASKTYTNPLGNFASVGDTEALPGGGKAFSDVVVMPGSMDLGTAALYSELQLLDLLPASAAAPQGDCTASATALCLNNDRFQIEVSWEDFQGNTGVGQAVGMTSDTGYFWFFDDSNVELILKVLDARGINNHFWVFYGALSNVEYEITVTDTVSGEVKTYANPSGNFASAGDTEAFEGS